MDRKIWWILGGVGLYFGWRVWPGVSDGHVATAMGFAAVQGADDTDDAAIVAAARKKPVLGVMTVQGGPSSLTFKDPGSTPATPGVTPGTTAAPSGSDPGSAPSVFNPAPTGANQAPVSYAPTGGDAPPSVGDTSPQFSYAYAPPDSWIDFLNLPPPDVIWEPLPRDPDPGTPDPSPYVIIDTVPAAEAPAAPVDTAPVYYETSGNENQLI